VGAGREGPQRQSSAVALARAADGATLAYVADADEPRLHTVEIAGNKEVAVTVLHGAPEHVLVLADGRVAVTLRHENALQVLEPAASAAAPLEARCVVDLPSEPIAMASTPDDSTLLVTSGWAHRLTVLDAASLARRFDADLPREPRGVIVSPDGTKAFVAHVVGAQMSVVDLSTKERAVRHIDLRARTRDETFHSPTAKETLRAGCQGFALTEVDDRGDRRGAKTDARVFAPMVSVDPGNPERPASGYGNPGMAIGTETAEVSVVDGAAERALTQAILVVSTSSRATKVDECLLPRAAAYREGALYVTCLGIDAVVRLDARALDPARAETRRWQVPAGPTGVAIDGAGARAVVWSQFDRAVSVIPLDGATTTVASIPLSRTAGSELSPEIALGRRLFHLAGDPRISRDGRACASCHPDGREDALTWVTPEGRRQTPMLAGRLEGTAPYGWLGGGATIEAHVTRTFQRLSGTGLDSSDLAALLAYVVRMAPPSLQVPPSAEQKKLIDRGEALFFSNSTECSTCHDPSRGFADGERHEVGGSIRATKGARKSDSFDTPSLRFVGGTAPYFHDGRYASLDDLLYASDHAMGYTMQLSRDDRVALVAYLEAR
jgi:DNA-binding beta-propeller fold protein YncE